MTIETWDGEIPWAANRSSSSSSQGAAWVGRAASSTAIATGPPPAHHSAKEGNATGVSSAFSISRREQAGR
jgi:hypothetical protein